MYRSRICRFMGLLLCMILLTFFSLLVTDYPILPSFLTVYAASKPQSEVYQGRNSLPQEIKDIGSTIETAHFDDHRLELQENYARALSRLQSDLVPNVGHIVWCGNASRQFEFHHYISAVSLIKALQPDLIYFHHSSSLPQEDKNHYNTWFTELVDRFPYFKAIRMKKADQVCSRGHDQGPPKLSFILSQLNQTGGVYLNEHTILTGFPTEYRQLDVINALDEESGTGFTMSGIGKMAEIESGTKKRNRDGSRRRSPITQCQDVSNYTSTNYTLDISRDQLGCVVTPSVYYPKDIMTRTDDFGRLVRRLFYDTEDILQPKPSYETLAPNIAHIVWVKGGTMNFLFYLCCLSLIYIQEVDMVYIYGDKPPSGEYWDKIEGHPKVTHVYRPSDVIVFNSTQVTFLGHVSDIWRVDLILKYGGIYTDVDTIFTRKLDDRYMGYDAVGSFDWPQNQLPFQDVVSLAPTIGKPGAKFYQLARDTWHTYRKSEFNWNGLRQPYKLWERHPDLLQIEPHLQVICFYFLCHPTWVEGYHNGKVNHNTTNSIKDWRKDTHVFHWTVPCPPEFANETTLLQSKGMFAEIGQYVLEKAGLIQRGDDGNWKEI